MNRMTHKNFLRILGIAAIILTGLANQAFTQAVMWSPSYTIGTTTGNYAFSYMTIPDPLVELSPPAIGEGNFSFQWEWSLSPTTGFSTDFTLPGAPQLSGGSGLTTLTFSAPLTQTIYFARQALAGVPILYPINGATYVVNTSNTVKLSVVSLYWQDINYVREHDVLTTNVTTFPAVDQLQIGQQLQTTVYKDGMDRPLQKVSRQTATPSQPNGIWEDRVSFYQYDITGRESIKYLPYSTPITATPDGRYQTNPVNDQGQYMGQNYQDAGGYYSLGLEPSPMNRIFLVRDPGTPLQLSRGKTTSYDMNSSDGVPILGVDYVQGDAPVMLGYYSPNTLFKNTYTDENNHSVVEYTNLSGQLILRKTQIDPAAAFTDAGYACTYYVYDDFGQLCYQIQPEGVKYLDANAWSFAGTAGQTVLAEQCFQYIHDDKGHTIWKKAPGAAPLNMLYDTRDRINFEQDGNQAAMTTPQWTAHLYDALDRPVITTLYNSTETIASLQTDIASASSIATTVNNVSVLGNPISAANMANASVTTILKYQYYDNYSFATAKAFNTGFTNTSAYNTSDPNVMQIVQTGRATDLPTGTLTRVLGTSLFLGFTAYYDEKGRQIQTLEDNIKSGTDINTAQYHFDGHILSSCNTHSAPGTDYAAGFTTLTKFIFDKLARVISIQKQLGANPLKTVANYDFDDMGRVKTKHLDPNYNNPNGSPDLESLNSSFNIRGQLTGINKDYALKTPATYNKWGHFFGMYIGYDNSDNIFNAAQLDGQITGLLWNTQGDDAQRRYDYTYDNADRLINAAFTQQQHPGDGWSNGQMDFSVSGASGQITYDYNGNLQTMLQKGVSPGTATPITIDDLRYTYASYSNKLQSVTDQMLNPTVNGQFGDFKDGTNAVGTPDYVYDNNGNLVIDLNKNVQSLNNGAAGTNGISYNYLDKPEQIRVVGKGTIKIVYDADGMKLQRVFIPESGAPSSITTYIGSYVYQETATLTLSSPAPFSGTSPALSFISFEEGRIRIMTPGSVAGSYDGFAENGNITLLNGKMGAWDYFVRDYQSNVRMILTEETHSAYNTCTMETTGGRPAAEDPVFGQPGAGNEVETTRTNTPMAWTGNTGLSVSHLGNISGHNIGPNTLQKVMAGDLVSASVQYYYQGPITNSNPSIVANILSSLAGALGGNATVNTLVHGNAAAITGQLNGTTGFVQAVQPTGAGGTTPQAFLTILFFDERFNFISAADGGVYQQQVASSWTAGTSPLALPNSKAPKNGYAFVYVSNRSDQDVYFDNLAVGITTGNIIEEDHYYAYGLKIAGISSKKLGDGGEGTLKNNYLYNDKELFDDGDLNWYDYGFRNYDPQIGRFTQLDPLSNVFAELSPYQYASCEPVANVDLDGLEATEILTAAKTAETAAEPVLSIVGNLEPVVVYPARVAAKMSPSVLSVVGHFGLGIFKGAWDLVKGVGEVVMHPITTASMIVHVVLHPIQMVKAIGKAVKQTYRDFKTGNANTKADILGQAILNVAAQFVPGVGEVKDAETVIKGIEVAEDVEKAEVVAEDVDKLSQEAKALGSEDAPAKFKTEPEEASPAKNGETSATKRGKEMHAKYKAEDELAGHGKKEVPLDNGKFRADYIDFDNNVIYELKPNNPRAIRAGKKQLANYKKLAEKEFNRTFTTHLDTY